MTYKEALRSVVNYPLTDSSLEKALLDAGLVATDTYTQSDQKAIDLVAAELLLVVCTSPDISQGGYRVSIGDRGLLMNARNKLLAKWGKGGGIRAGNYW